MLKKLAILLAILLPFGAAAQKAHPYAVVHGWPILPEGRVLGPAAGVAVSPKGETYVFHRGNRGRRPAVPGEVIAEPTIAVFDAASGRLLREWGGGRFVTPHGLTIDARGHVWLTDTGLDQVFEFDAAGNLLLMLGERGVAGKDAAHFDRPTDVAVLPDGGFLVSDGYGNTRVMHFAADGRFLSQWGEPGSGPGQLNLPHALAVDRAGHVYVADRGNSRVQVFDADGKALAAWQSPAIGRPFGLAILGTNRMAIADGGDLPAAGPDHDGIAVTDLQGHVLERFGRFGNQDGQFWIAHDIAADAKGNLYVVDVTGQRVQKFTRR
jgi:DNA-binding beta-propeller fold protein YncE